MNERNEGVDSYEAKVQRLEEILRRLDNSATPIDELATDVKAAAGLIRELDEKLRSVEAEVMDAFKELESAPRPFAPEADAGSGGNRVSQGFPPPK